MKKNKVHYHLLDLLKMSALIAIMILHFWEFVFYVDPYTMEETSWAFTYILKFARIFSQGGQILVAVVYFLFGFNQRSRSFLLKVSGFALLGQLVLYLIFETPEWDIYAFIALTNLFLLLLPENNRSSKVFIGVSFLMLLTPIPLLQKFAPAGEFFDILTGRLTHTNSGSWAPLPWFFLSSLFFSLGNYVKKNLSDFTTWNRFENFLWPALLILATPFLGFYIPTPIGPSYYQYNFSQWPWIFWANFIPVLLWMRLSFITGIQQWLHERSFVRWVSSLEWSRNVGVTYLISVIYVGIAARYEQEMSESPLLFDLVFLGIMPTSEFITRGLRKLTKIGRRA